MVEFPQLGGCVCGDIRYEIREDPICVYACHCTDCQTETGSAFYMSVVVRPEAFDYTKGRPEVWEVSLPDGRTKGAEHCPRCKTNLGGQSDTQPIRAVDGGTFDDTSWIIPAGHIWTRSAQPWIALPETSVQFEEMPGDRFTDIVRAWKGRDAS